MGKTTLGRGMLFGFGVFFLFGALADAANPPAAGRTRVEAEIMPVHYTDEVLTANDAASGAFDASASGQWYLNCRRGWVYIENIVAPADGYYLLTFRLRGLSPGGSTVFCVRNDQAQWYESWAFGAPAQVSWYDYTYTGSGQGVWLAAGANTLEFGSGSGWFQMDYVEFDTSTGLRYEPVPKHRPLRIEAESAILTGANHPGNDGSGRNAAVVQSDAGSSGGACLAFHNPANNPAVTATYTFTMPPGSLTSTYALYLRFAARHPAAVAADGTGSAQWDEILINGTVVARTDIPYNDTNWHELVLAEYIYWYWNLVEGTNTIAIRSAWHNIQYDYLEIEGLGPVAPEGRVTVSPEPYWEENTLRLSAPSTTSSRPDFSGWHYQWMLNGQPLSDGGGISGSKDRVLVIDWLLPAHEGIYTVSYRHAEYDPVVSLPCAISDVGPKPQLPAAGTFGLCTLTVLLGLACFCRLSKPVSLPPQSK